MQNIKQRGIKYRVTPPQKKTEPIDFFLLLLQK